MLDPRFALFLPLRLDVCILLPRPACAAKRIKGASAALLGASSSAGLAPSSAGKGGSEAHASPTRSSSRAQQGHSGEESAPVAPLTLEAPALDAVIEVFKAQGALPPKP